MFSADPRKSQYEERSTQIMYGDLPKSSRSGSWSALVMSGLQDRARQKVGACRGLPHNILDTELDKESKIWIVKIEYWLIELGGSAKNQTQDFLQLCVSDCLCKQVNQDSVYFSAMLIQSPI